MKIRKMFVIGLSAFFLSVGPAFAQGDSLPSAKRPTREQMRAVHECAAKKGVRLPDFPKERASDESREKRGPRRLAGADARGDQDNSSGGTKKLRQREPWFDRQKGDKEDVGGAEFTVNQETQKESKALKGRKPHLTEKQRVFLDECFKENGLTPPSHRGRGKSSKKAIGE